MEKATRYLNLDGLATLCDKIKEYVSGLFSRTVTAVKLEEWYGPSGTVEGFDVRVTINGNEQSAGIIAGPNQADYIPGLMTCEEQIAIQTANNGYKAGCRVLHSGIINMATKTWESHYSGAKLAAPELTLEAAGIIKFKTGATNIKRVYALASVSQNMIAPTGAILANPDLCLISTYKNTSREIFFNVHDISTKALKNATIDVAVFESYQ